MQDPLPELLGDVVGMFGRTRVIHISEGLNLFPRTATAASYTAVVTDYIIGVTSTSSARTITLPTAASAGKGRVLIIKDESGAAGTNNITIDGNGAETIDGAATKVISTNYGVIRIYSDGTAWFTI